MQEVRSWVSSPLGQHYLLAMFKDTGGTLGHYLKKYVSLHKKPEFKMSNKLFLTPTCQLQGYLKEEYKVDQVQSPRDAALQWVKNQKDVLNNGLENNVPESAQMVFLNVSTFKSPWANNNGNALMKIYNSFSYTQDVNYEARILELPLRDKDFKMIVIAPNDVDLLHTLFRRLSHEGLRAAICNIQPLFTVQSKLMAPDIRVTSEETYQESIGQLGAVTISQCGKANVSDQGAQFSVLSYLYTTWALKTPPEENQAKLKKQPFFFGLVYDDIPIFTGQFNSDFEQ